MTNQNNVLNGIEKRLRGYLENLKNFLGSKNIFIKIDIDLVVGVIMTHPRPSRKPQPKKISVKGKIIKIPELPKIPKEVDKHGTIGSRKKRKPLGNIMHPEYQGDHIIRDED